MILIPLLGFGFEVLNIEIASDDLKQQSIAKTMSGIC
jgi:hypothetical protein